MSVIKGKVEAKSKGRTSRGTYGVKIGDKWYNSQEAVSVERGDQVEAEVEGSDLISIKKIGGGSSAGGGGKGGNWETAEERASKQRSIERQTALNDAIHLAETCLANGVKLGKDYAEIEMVILSTAEAFAGFLSAAPETDDGSED